MTCLFEEAAKITRWSVDVYRVVAQRTNHVVLTIGIPQTCFIVSATVTTFPFIDWEKHIINCHTSRPVPMIEECCIGAVIGLGCIGAIWKKQRMNKFKYNQNIVINIYLKFVKFSYIFFHMSNRRILFFLQLCETCKININEIKKNMLAVGLVWGSYQIYFSQAPSLQVCHNANYICVEGLIPLVFTNDLIWTIFCVSVLLLPCRHIFGKV